MINRPRTRRPPNAQLLRSSLAASLLMLLMPVGAARAADPHTVSATETLNGKPLRVHVGDRVRVTLASTYWEFAPVTGKAVRTVGQAEVIVGGPSCPKIMGTGCGTATLTVKAVVRGASTVRASRSACGEALQCSSDKRTYAVRIIVS